jgi:putative ABC transport system substrate-binding protein
VYVSCKLVHSQLRASARQGHQGLDLFVERPTKFEFMTNSRTAKVLSLTIPPSLLLRADEVIQ